MALVQVFCGLASADETVRSASAGPSLSIAVVDDAGRLLGVHEVSDDAAGYARLATLLVERTSGFTDTGVAADSDDHLVTSLLTAAGRPLAVADDDSVDGFAARYVDDQSAEERQAPPAARRAIGLARALRAGALTATDLSAPREFVTYKPVLAAHLALLNGRYAAAGTLHDVLRELYPAALRAYPDPSMHLPLAVLDLVPEPGPLTGALSRGQDPGQVADEVVARLVADGIGDNASVVDAVTALLDAVGDSPRRGGVNKSLASAVGEAVRHAIGAVRSCDAACAALVATLAARVSPPAAERRMTARRAAPAEQAAGGLPSRPTTGAATRAGRRGRQEPAASTMPVTPRPMTAPPVAPQPIMPPPLAPRPVSPRPVSPSPMAPAASNGLPSRTPSGPPGNSPVSVPPPPPGMTPITPGSRNPVPPATTGTRGAPRANGRGPVPPVDAGQPFRPTITNAAINSARAERQRTVIPPRPNTRTQPAPSAPAAGFGATDYSSIPMPTPQALPEPVAEPGSRANWPLVAHDDRSDDRVSVLSDNRVRPPWQADDLPAEPPSLRLVEPQLGAPGSDPGLSDPMGAPPLRLVDRDTSDRLGRNGRSSRRTTLTALDRSTTPPVADEGDGDLLIFAAARSAWFTGQNDQADSEWASQADTGWRAAEKAAVPEVAAETTAGLPKRVPQANLVPGSPLREERPLRIVRDAASIAAHTTGYFRGWRRGQEIGGYAIGGRPGREAAGGWDFTRDGGGQNEDFHNNNNNAGYRSS